MQKNEFQRKGIMKASITTLFSRECSHQKYTMTVMQDPPMQLEQDVA
jgi:hypothetical protein